MKVFVYECADAPAPSRFMARVWCEFTGKGNKPVMGWHPVIVPAETAEDAEAKATTFWADELAAAERKKANAEKRAAARKTAPALPTLDGGA